MYKSTVHRLYSLQSTVSTVFTSFTCASSGRLWGIFFGEMGQIHSKIICLDFKICSGTEEDREKKDSKDDGAKSEGEPENFPGEML